jgi:hypothetical protein
MKYGWEEGNDATHAQVFAIHNKLGNFVERHLVLLLHCKLQSPKLHRVQHKWLKADDTDYQQRQCKYQKSRKKSELNSQGLTSPHREDAPHSHQHHDGEASSAANCVAA